MSINWTMSKVVLRDPSKVLRQLFRSITLYNQQRAELAHMLYSFNFGFLLQWKGCIHMYFIIVERKYLPPVPQRWVLIFVCCYDFCSDCSDCFYLHAHSQSNTSTSDFVPFSPYFAKQDFLKKSFLVDALYNFTMNLFSVHFGEFLEWKQTLHWG